MCCWVEWETAVKWMSGSFRAASRRARKVFSATAMRWKGVGSAAAGCDSLAGERGGSVAAHMDTRSGAGKSGRSVCRRAWEARGDLPKGLVSRPPEKQRSGPAEAGEKSRVLARSSWWNVVESHKVSPRGRCLELDMAYANLEKVVPRSQRVIATVSLLE